MKAPCCLPSMLGLVILSSALRGADEHVAERQTPAVAIAPGQSPDVAVDPGRRVVHLVYRQPRAGATGNFLHFARIEAGVKVGEGRKISERTAPHGESYRHTPAIAAHPDGGIVVVFEETGAPNTLYFVTVGAGAR